MGFINRDAIKSATTPLPARVRGGVDESGYEEIFADFLALIDAAKESEVGEAYVAIEGPVACNAVQNALGKTKTRHPTTWAQLWTLNSKVEGGKMVSFTLAAAARPLDRKMAKLAG